MRNDTGFNPHFDQDFIEAVEGLLNEPTVESASFPFEVFPEQIQRIISETNEDLDFPIDYMSGAILFASSIAIGNTAKVQVKKGFEEGATMYLALVGKPGANKSAPLSFALKPIHKRDQATYKEYEIKKAQYNEACQISRAERKSEGIEDPVKPVWNKFLLSDYTQEGLAEVHKFNPRGLGVYADELAGWFKNFNRYNKGSDIEFWLSTWSGKPINIDRKTGDPVYIPHPFISVAGTIQNALLSEMAKDREGNGFLHRILFVIPDNISKPYWSETDIDPLTVDSWVTIIERLLSLPLVLNSEGSIQPDILHFSSEAKKALFEWQRSNVDDCNKSHNESLSGAFSKLEIYTIRFALILELLSWACNESDKSSISEQSVMGAIKLVEYFKRSAEKVHGILANDNPLSKYPTAKQTLYSILPDSFTTAECVEIANDMDSSLKMSERTVKSFLNSPELFKRIKAGQYEKLL